MRSVTRNNQTNARGGSRLSGAGIAPAGQALGAIGRRVLTGASTAVALHMAANAQAVTDDARKKHADLVGVSEASL